MDQIVNKCLKKERAERYQSAPELLIDLDNLQKGIFLPSRARSFINVRFAAAAAMLLLAVFVGGSIYRSWTDPAHTMAVTSIDCGELAPDQCKALNEGLITKLSHREGLRVIPSNVTPSLFGPNATSPQKVGRDLKADLVMYGGINRGEEGLILTIHVQRVADDSSWEQPYVIKPGKIATLPDKISLETAFALQLPTNEDTKTARALIAANDDRSPDAYRLYLQGRMVDWSRRDGPNIKLAIDNFYQATQLDANYAEAYAGLADCYVLTTTVGYGSLSSKEAITRAEWTANQAIKFGDKLAESHNALGSVLLKGRWDWEKAEKEFKRAIALNPDYQPAHLNYSMLLAITGRTEEALKEGELARNLDPFSGAAIMNDCRQQYYARQFEQANACLDELANQQPNYAGGKYLHGIVYIALGRIPEATQIFEEIYRNDPAYGGAMLGFSYGIANRRTEAERVLTEMEEYQKQHYLPDQELGIIYLGLNDLDHAFPLLQKSVDEKYFPAQSFFFSPLFERVRSDPRYVELARSVKLPSRPPTSPADVSNSAR